MALKGRTVKVNISKERLDFYRNQRITQEIVDRVMLIINVVVMMIVWYFIAKKLELSPIAYVGLFVLYMLLMFFSLYGAARTFQLSILWRLFLMYTMYSPLILLIGVAMLVYKINQTQDTPPASYKKI
jgi:hypothetical protein